MADIISFENFRLEAEQKTVGRLKKSKALEAHKGIRAARRPSRCEKCHGQASKSGTDRKQDPRRLHAPYVFCDSCLEEYIDFIDRLQGRGNPLMYWHNDAWLESWRRWIDYKSTLDQYVRSKEFTQLVREIASNTMDE